MMTKVAASIEGLERFSAGLPWADLEEAGFDYFTQAEQPYRRPIFEWVNPKLVEQTIDVWAKNKIEK